MIDQIAYEVQGGETWSSVAFKMYGDETLTEPIISNNPRVPITMRLPQGLILYVPILSSNDNVQIPSEALPPWQQ